MLLRGAQKTARHSARPTRLQKYHLQWQTHILCCLSCYARLKVTRRFFTPAHYASLSAVRGAASVWKMMPHSACTRSLGMAIETPRIPALTAWQRTGRVGSVRETPLPPTQRSTKLRRKGRRKHAEAKTCGMAYSRAVGGLGRRCSKSDWPRLRMASGMRLRASMSAWVLA